MAYADRVRLRPRRKRLMLVTGISGFLGKHIVIASELAEWELLSPSSTALDVREHARVLDEVTTWRPNVIVHLAYRRDDRETIVEGTRNVAVAAAAAGSRLIHISTDAVFGGRDRPYIESDRPDAEWQYGRWKAAAEDAAVAADGNVLVVRTSLLFGTDHQSPIQRDVADALSGRGRMRFYSDEYRCPAHAADVAAAIVQLADRTDITGFLHVAGPQRISRAALAAAFAQRMGADPTQLSSGPIEADRLRPKNLVLDVSLAASLGITCRSVADALAR